MKKKKQGKSDAIFEKFIGLCKKSGSFPIASINKVNLERGLLVLQDILELKNKYTVNKNFVYAIEAFLLAYRNKFETPIWVFLLLHKAFYKFHCSDGSLDLLSLLGLKAKQRRGNPYKTLTEEERNNSLVFDIQILRNVYNMPLRKAVEIVQKASEIAHEKQFINKQRRGSLCMSLLSKESILTYYNNSPFARRIRKDDFKTWVGDGDEAKLDYFMKEFAAAATSVSKSPGSEVTHDDIRKILSPFIEALSKELKNPLPIL